MICIAYVSIIDIYAIHKLCNILQEYRNFMHRCNYFDAICKQYIIYSVYKLEKKKHITIM